MSKASEDEPIQMEESQFIKSVSDKGWTVFTEDDLSRFRADLQVYARMDESEDSIVQQAAEDLGRLIPIKINDTIGRVRTMYRKPDTVKMSANGMVHQSVSSIITEAMDRHKHNTKVQRMSKVSSYANIERVYGVVVSAAVQSYNEKVGVSSVKKKDKKEDAKPALVKGDPTITDIDEAIDEFVDEQILGIEAGGYKVDIVWREGLRNNFNMLKEFIDTKDYFQLKEFLSVKNKDWRRFFEAYTGYELPNTDRETTKFLSQYAPF